MKNQTLLTIIFISAILLTSCSPTALSAPTETSSASTIIPTATTIPPTEQPHLNLQQDAILYVGPGTIDFNSIATLSAGSKIIPLGIYVDFVKVLAFINGNEVTGFMLKNVLGTLPDALPILQSNQVPWKPLYDPACSPGIYDPNNNTVTVANTGNNFYDLGSNAIHLDAPLHIRIESLTATGSQAGSIKLYGWRSITRMDIQYNNGKYMLGIRDGSTESYTAEVHDLGLNASQPIQIIFDQPEGKSFSVLDENGTELRHVDLESLGLNMPNGLFPDSNVFIGTSVGPNTKMTIEGLSIGILSNGIAVEQENIEPGLIELAEEHNLTIGTEFSLGSMMDKKYCNTMQKNFNVAVLSAFSWPEWWLGPDKYDFTILDEEVNYASQHGFRVRASHLVWGAAIPDWLRNGHFTRDEYINILEQYIKTIVGRYKGRVQEWSIANEAINRSITNNEDFWNEKIGPDYIEMSFRWAREVDPNGILILNDSTNDSVRDYTSRRVIEKMYATVHDLKAKGVPIDVVGMQMHMLIPWESQTPPKVENMVNTMQDFGKLGVRIYITEFDVNLHKRAGTQEERWQFEATIYKDALTACIESGVCDSFTTWGISDSTSWLTCDDVWCANFLLDADPLMFDHNFDPKPAYFAVRDTLRDFFKPIAP